MPIILDDLRALRQADQLASLYHHLGYPAELEPQGFTPEEAFLEGAATQGIVQVYLLVNHEGLQHVHLETTDLSTPALRRVATQFSKRPGHYLLSFSDPDY